MRVKRLAVVLATVVLLTVGTGVAYTGGPQDNSPTWMDQGYGQMMGYGNTTGYGSMMDREDRQDMLRAMQHGDQRELQRVCLKEQREFRGDSS
ncbi:MAG TPA: hypothetical protein VFJ72_05990 [Rubrobacteraceae bacterium]|nr:hypothetical protein [Rubrobacteraceae bacterium]